MGSGSYFAQEGVFEFGAKEWGPQPLQLMLSTVDCNGGSLGVAADTGVKEVKDLKGKRVGFVVGSPALNQNSLAVLAFGGLTQSDVKIVEFASYGAMWKGLINNDADAAFATTITGPAKEAETSPRGLVWPPLPAERQGRLGARAEGRLVLLPAYGNLRRRHLARTSRSSSATIPTRSSWPTRSQPADQVYADHQGDDRRLRRLQGRRARRRRPCGDRQTKKWVVPVHPGAVKALKEAGQWSDDQEAHNNVLFKRQEVLAAAWAELRQGQPAFGRQGVS